MTHRVDFALMTVLLAVWQILLVIDPCDVWEEVGTDKRASRSYIPPSIVLCSGNTILELAIQWHHSLTTLSTFIAFVLHPSKFLVQLPITPKVPTSLRICRGSCGLEHLFKNDETKIGIWITEVSALVEGTFRGKFPWFLS